MWRKQTTKLRINIKINIIACTFIITPACIYNSACGYVNIIMLRNVKYIKCYIMHKIIHNKNISQITFLIRNIHFTGYTCSMKKIKCVHLTFIKVNIQVIMSKFSQNLSQKSRNLWCIMGSVTFFCFAEISFPQSNDTRAPELPFPPFISRLLLCWEESPTRRSRLENNFKRRNKRLFVSIY